MKSDWMSSFIGLVSESTRLPKWHSGKESAASARDTRDVGLIPGSGRSPGVGNGDLLQYSCLQSSTDRGDCPWSHKELDMTEVTEHTHQSPSGDRNHSRYFSSESEKESEVAQSCLTLCGPMDCSLPGSSVHGISQARMGSHSTGVGCHSLLQGIFPTQVSRIAGRCFTVWALVVNLI